MMSHDLISTLTTDELVDLLDRDERLFMIDVRETDEVADWQIPGVHNIPLGELDRSVAGLPRDAHFVVICAKGARALQGATILADHSVHLISDT